ncbi:MAG: hypothetical protein ABI968_00220 [Acidobacteriota bacterium]
MTTEVSLEDAARFQNTVIRVAAAPPAVPVPCGEFVTWTQPAGEVIVTASFAVSQTSKPISLVRCAGQTTVAVVVLFTTVPAA